MTYTTSRPIVSIVIPTFNRLALLQRCIQYTVQNTDLARLPAEIVVVDGGSTDGTRPWLANQPFLTTILEQERKGAVAAFNLGFKAAKGEFIMWLNDDAYPLKGSIEAALEFIRDPRLSDVGIAAFYHSWHSPDNILDQVERAGETYQICHVRGYPYANFGLIHRDLMKEIGYADEQFRFFGFDPDLSLKVQLLAGKKVLGCRNAIIYHDEHHDDRKVGDLDQGAKDNELLFRKWPLPEKGAYPDPGPDYRKDLIRRGLLRPAIAG